MKRIIEITLLLFIFFISINPSYADVYQIGTVDVSGKLNVRSNAGASYSKVGIIFDKETIIINNTRPTQDSSNDCPSNSWYNITTIEGDIFSGYVCSSYITNIKTINDTPSESCNISDSDFEANLIKQGFPTSYLDKLKALHKAHPCWVFKANQAKYSWANTLSQENELGTSLYQVTDYQASIGLQGYLSTVKNAYDYATDKFTPYDGSTWFQASSKTIEYYMDPRNFLTESGIFMFEDLTFYESYQTADTVKKVLYTDAYSNLIGYYIEAAKKYNVSPVYLAALSRQEVGLNIDDSESVATNGKAGSYNNVNYNNYYNFYNIGANSGTNPVYNGLAYAKSQGWNTRQKAIVEGASWIVNGYINQGQYTRYFQKWNVSSSTTTGIWHQYATDVKTVVSPAATTASTYKAMGITNEPIVFTIPVYVGMPTSTSLPNTGNPNNWLKSLTVDDKSVTNFSGSTTSYNLGEVEYNKTSISIKGTTVNSNASISGIGTTNIAVGKNTINVVVTAQNGDKRTYTLTITRKEGTNNNTDIIEPDIVTLLTKMLIKNNDTNIYGIKVGTTASNLSQNAIKENANSIVKVVDKNGNEKTNTALATGDKFTITSNNKTKTYNVIIYGDLNGDASINAKDLLLMRKYLLKTASLNDSYLEAAKVIKEDKVTAKDLLQLRKHLLGTSTINQG